MNDVIQKLKEKLERSIGNNRFDEVETITRSLLNLYEAEDVRYRLELLRQKNEV